MTIEVKKDLVLKVAELANLKLAPSEVTHYEEQLKKILAFIDQLNQVNTEEAGVAGDFHGDKAASFTSERIDQVAPSLNAEEVMAAAPQHIGTAFQVPRILE